MLKLKLMTKINQAIAHTEAHCKDKLDNCSMGKINQTIVQAEANGKDKLLFQMQTDPEHFWNYTLLKIFSFIWSTRTKSDKITDYTKKLIFC